MSARSTSASPSAVAAVASAPRNGESGLAATGQAGGDVEPDLTCGPLVIWNEDAWVPMSDGVRLHAMVTRPDVPYPVPVVLIRTPYLPFTPVALDLVAVAGRGVAVIVQSTRGTGRSEGEFDPFQHEAGDGAETVAWCAAQPWSNGKVGTLGRSYLALTQQYTSAVRPDAITAMALEVVPGRPYDWVYPGGAFLYGMLLYWAMRHARAGMARAAAAGADVTADQAAWQQQMTDFDQALNTGLDTGTACSDKYFPTWRQWLEHPRDDDWWAARDRPGGLSTDVPALYVGGWRRPFPERHSGCVQRQHPPSQPARGRAVGAHREGISARPGQLRIRRLGRGDRPRRPNDRLRPDPHLGGEPRPRRPRVSFFVMGANHWRQTSHWPPPGTNPKLLFPHPGGSLSPTPPADHHALNYVSDPLDPAPTLGGANFFIGSDGGYLTGQWDQRDLDGRNDVLRFATDPLAVDLEVIGRVSLTLRCSTSIPSTDWTAKLVDIHPDGRPYNIVDGIRRVHHGTPAQDTGMTDPAEVEIVLGDTAQLFRRGHRIRLDIANSNYPRFDRNLGTMPVTSGLSDESNRVVHHRVVLDPNDPVMLTIPVLREPL